VISSATCSGPYVPGLAVGLTIISMLMPLWSLTSMGYHYPVNCFGSRRLAFGFGRTGGISSSRARCQIVWLTSMIPACGLSLAWPTPALPLKTPNANNSRRALQRIQQARVTLQELLT